MKEKEIDNNMETKEKAKTILNWDYINKEFESAIIQEDSELNLIKMVFVGDCKMLPSGKYYTQFTTNDITEEEIELDNDFIGELIEEVNDNIMPNDIEFQYLDISDDNESMYIIRVFKTRYQRYNNYITLNPRNFLTDTI